MTQAQVQEAAPRYVVGQNIISPKKRGVALLLWVLGLGILGLHRFYVGKIGTGIIFFLTMSLLYFGGFYDLLLILTGNFRDADNRKLVTWW